MKKLSKVTLQYVALEDRLLLIGIDEAGQTLRLWLTQRLLLRVLPVYLRTLGLDSPGAAIASAGAATSSDATAPRASAWEHREALSSELIQGFAQQRARLDRPTLEPVSAEPGSPVFLIHKVDVGQLKNGAALTFIGVEPDEKARLSLTGQAVRHWINGLYDVCVKAQWPLHAFPQWVAEAARPASPDKSGSSLH